MSARWCQNREDELRKKILTDISPKLDQIMEASAGNRSDREMIAAMTADNLTVTSKLDAVLAENQRVLAENRRFKSRLDVLESNQTVEVKTETGKTETELNSNGETCPVEKGHGKFRSYWFFKDQQYCKTCKKMTRHLPNYCPELPERKKRKAEFLASRKAGGK